MIVDRRKILLGSLNTGTTIDIALSTNFFPVDNAELIQDKFVNEEVEKAINPIVDYKKVLFKPARGDNWEIIDTFKYNLNFYTPESINLGNPLHRGSAAEPGVYADLGFKFDDVFCRTNRFVNSFLRFSFFDNPNSGQNELLGFADIYTQVGPDQENQFGFTLPISGCEITLNLGDPVTQPDEVHEGFHIYWFKDLVDNSPSQEYVVYGVFQFNSALNGRIYNMAASKQIIPNDVNLSNIEGEDGILYLKIILKNDNGVYKYKFEPNAKQLMLPPGVNLNPSGGGTPTITLWQITP